MSMRVLVLLNRIPWPIKDGGTLSHYNLIAGLYKQGCLLTIAAINTQKHFINPETLPHAFTKLGKLHTSYLDNRIKPIAAFRNLFSKKSYHIERFDDYKFANMLTNLLQNETFDWIICDGLYVTPYLSIIKKYSKAKVWLREHNIEFEIWETLALQTKLPIKRWYLKHLAQKLKNYELQILNEFDALIALTNYDKNRLVNLGCIKPILELPVGVELVRTQINAQPQPFSVFHLGAMDWQPNIQAVTWFVENVWSKVITKIPQAVFYIAGKNMPDSFAKYQSKSIKIIGEVDDAIAFMQSKQVMVVPLLAGSGIRVKILEGMSIGKAIVSTSLGAQGIYTDNAILIADSASDFANCIVELLNNTEQAETLGANAKRIAFEKYDNNKVMEQLLNFYNTL